MLRQGVGDDGAADDGMDAFRVHAQHTGALAAGEAGEGVEKAGQGVTADAVAVHFDDGVDFLAAAGQAGEEPDGAAGADQGGAGGQGRHFGFGQGGADIFAGGAQVGGGGTVGESEKVGDAEAAQRQGAGGKHRPVLEGDDFGAAAADVGQQAIADGEAVDGADEAVGGFVGAVDNPQGDAGAPGGGGHGGGVAGFAEGGGGHGVDDADAVGAGHQGEIGQGVQGGGHAGGVEHPAGVQVAHQVEGDALLGEDFDAAAGMRLHDYGAGGTGADVNDGGDVAGGASGDFRGRRSRGGGRRRRKGGDAGGGFRGGSGGWRRSGGDSLGARHLL